jgi:hypothetical protein
MVWVRVTFLRNGIQRGRKQLGWVHHPEEGRMDEEMDRTWQALSEEVLFGVKEWRLAHPKATFREIEHAVEERVNRLKAQMRPACSPRQ